MSFAPGVVLLWGRWSSYGGRCGRCAAARSANLEDAVPDAVLVAESHRSRFAAALTAQADREVRCGCAPA
ncbi:MAG TPA: hypothetical protein VMZ92_10700 [Planctomycetota bacterium]|nr:hypothetical protein [Planctomycetota bacterium]